MHTHTHTHTVVSSWGRGWGLWLAWQRVAHADAKPNSKVRLWILLIVVLSTSHCSFPFRFHCSIWWKIFFDSKVACGIVYCCCTLLPGCIWFIRANKQSEICLNFHSNYRAIIEHLSRLQFALSPSFSLSLCVSITLSLCFSLVFSASVWLVQCARTKFQLLFSKYK